MVLHINVVTKERVVSVLVKDSDFIRFISGHGIDDAGIGSFSFHLFPVIVVIFLVIFAVIPFINQTALIVGCYDRL